MKEQQLKQQVAQYWDSQPCGSFASQAAPGERSFYEEVTRHRYARQPYMQELVGFDDYAGQRLLEVGCGLGTDLRQFALGGAQVVGIDLSARSVRLARRHFEVYQTRGDFCNSDAENLPFASATFDVVYSFGVLHHTPHTQRALDECFRVLKPGGRLILMLYNSHSWHVRVDPYLRNVYRLLTGRPGLPGGVLAKPIPRRRCGTCCPALRGCGCISATSVFRMVRLSPVGTMPCCTAAASTPAGDSSSSPTPGVRLRGQLAWFTVCSCF